MTGPEEEVLRGAVQTLMTADNFGDVHEALNQLVPLLGMTGLEGNFLDGWTDADYAGVGFEADA